MKIYNIAQKEHRKATLTQEVDQILIAIDAGGELELVIAGPCPKKQTIKATVGLEAVLLLTTIDLDADGLVRHTEIELLGEGAECYISGVYIARGTDCIENYTSITHRGPQSYSEQKFHGIATDKSKVTFGGLIHVAPHAQQTIALQENHNISLSDTAKVYSQPQLEIYADDVKCNHGATVGRRNEQAIFYMRQRGLSEAEAQALLLESFALSPLNDGVDDQIRDSVIQMIHSL